MSISKRGWASIHWGLLGLAAGCVCFAGGPARADKYDVAKALVSPAIDSTEPIKDVVEAVTRFNNGDFDSARLFLNQARKDNPKLPPAELMLAQMLASANQGQAARAELERCVKMNPDDPEAYLIFGDGAFADGRVTDAEMEFAKAKALTANFKENAKRERNFNVRSEAGLAAVCEAREDWDGAKTHLEAWLTIVDPLPAKAPAGSPPREKDSAPAHERLGRVLFKADKSNDKKVGARAAFEQFQMAVQADEKSPAAEIALAQLYEEAKLHERATHFVSLAVQGVNSQQAVDTQLATLLAAAHWALESDQINEARDYSSQALRVSPKSLEAKFLRGVAARLLGDTKTAETEFEEVFLASPGNFAASNQYAQVLAEQNDKEKRDKALEIARMNEKMFGGQNSGARGIETAATLGWVLFQMDKVTEAGQVMEAILKSGNANPDSLYYAARILKERGQPENAVKLLQAALKNYKAFVHRNDAKSLLVKLGGSEDTTATPASTPKSGGDSGTTPPAASGSGDTKGSSK